mgnify:CR=1 FL=1
MRRAARPAALYIEIETREVEERKHFLVLELNSIDNINKIVTFIRNGKKRRSRFATDFMLISTIF